MSLYQIIQKRLEDQECLHCGRDCGLLVYCSSECWNDTTPIYHPDVSRGNIEKKERAELIIEIVKNKILQNPKITMKELGYIINHPYTNLGETLRYYGFSIKRFKSYPHIFIDKVNREYKM